MVTYQIVTDALSGSSCILRMNESSNASYIPMDEANTDYQAYLAWLMEGNTPEPWPPTE